jgi:hypothetical protein
MVKNHRNNFIIGHSLLDIGHSSPAVGSLQTTDKKNSYKA